ncbi:MAG: DUF1232 domain-containing protein, partial [Candidatus Obscuribacterales bacterium]|nr:DUF1232 domain-containing protein [Candidatus Obscuribacterales bacterium]
RVTKAGKTNARGQKRASGARAVTVARRGVRRSKTPHSKPRRAAPLTRDEVTQAVVELANKLAPADVGDLLVAESMIRERAAQLSGVAGRVLRGELELALMCLKDHASGRCPQIPYYTISLLAAGVAYLADQLDFVPDFLPRIGMLDDALVMAVACDLSRDGLKRYCVWKGLAPALARRAQRRLAARTTR